ncbi:MAG TPA: hypothetical protein VL832_06670 [Puia sp.]|nr:hypothetical protein [Puia sp.]
MFNNIVLDVFIGLIFVFLLYSLLATIFQEFIAQIIDLRAKMLQKGIARMLRDDNKDKKKDPPQALWKKFYDNPAIKYLSESNRIYSKPSYISPANFSKTIIQVLRGDQYDGSTPELDEIKATLKKAELYNSQFPSSSARVLTTLPPPAPAAAASPATMPSDTLPPVSGTLPPASLPPVLIEPQTLRQLNNLLVDSRNDIDRFRALLEQWFNDTMSRVSGWYKKQTQWILLGVGMGIAIAGNVDTLKIYGILARDKTAREQMVNIAIQSQQKYTSAIEELNRIQKDTSFQVAGRQITTKSINFTTGNTMLDSAYRDVKSDLAKSESILAIGWNNIDTVRKYDSLQKALAKLKTRSDSTHTADTLSFGRLRDEILALEKRERILFRAITWKSWLGWLLTALAISLGAPFWFDMLNKVVSLRAAGNKPESTSEKKVDKK